MKSLKTITQVIFSSFIIISLVGCPSDQDKQFEPTTKKEAETQNLIKKSLDSNALNIENEKINAELIIASKKIAFQISLIATQLKDIKKKEIDLKAIKEKQIVQTSETNSLKKLMSSLSNNLEDKNKLIKELQQKITTLEEKLKIFHQNSDKLNSNDLKEKTQYIKDLLIEVEELKKANKQFNLNNQKLKDKIIELEKAPPKNLPD